MIYLEKIILLRTIDSLWIEHLRAIDELREGIGLRGYGQRDPLVAYKSEAFLMFEQLLHMIKSNVVKAAFRAQLQTNQPSTIALQKKGSLPKNLPATQKNKKFIPEIDSSKSKIGRNDPCICGSGKKYKKCCGKEA